MVGGDALPRLALGGHGLRGARHDPPRWLAATSRWGNFNPRAQKPCPAVRSG
jgi:hypothetical protein